MRLNRLRLTNFRLHVDTRIDFEAGLTGIIGPNGSGKTTILEAIAWALYGMTAVRGKRQDVRSLAASGRAGVRVELDFDLAGHRYRVARTLSSAELYLDGSSSPIANSTTAVTELIRRKLGMSQQEFFNTYFTGQKELGIMAAMGPAERAQFLSRVLGYEKLRGAQTLVRERRNVIRGELTGLESGMPQSEVVALALSQTDARLKSADKAASTALERLKKADAALTRMKPKWAEAQRERDAMQQLLAELRVQENEERGLARDVERLERERADIATAQAEIAEISEELNIHKDLAAQLHEMERLFQEEGRRKELLRSRRTVEQEITALRGRRGDATLSPATLKEAERVRDAARKRLAALTQEQQAEHTRWVQDQQEASTKVDDYKQQHDELKRQREQLANLGPESPCPVCTRPLGTHFREVLDEIDGRLAEIKVNGRYWRSKSTQLKELPANLTELGAQTAELQRNIEQLERALTDTQLRLQEQTQIDRDLAERDKRLAGIDGQLAAIPAGYHAATHAQMRQRHAQLAPLAEKSARLGALTERLPKVKKELERATTDLGRVRERLEDLRLRQKESKFSESAFEKLKTSHEATLDEHRAAQLAALAADKELEAAREARAAAERGRDELARAQERLRLLTLDRRTHDELDRAFTDIRAELNEHVRPEISDLASGFLAELTDGRYTDLELDDDYNVIVKEDDVPKPVISGGEEDLANLVLRLAISQMIAERAGQAFSLLVLDEVFGSLDETRRHNVVELLRRLHDRFEQVILITHIESVREGLDRVLTVRYDPETQTSRVEQESALALETEESSLDAYAGAGTAGAAGAAD
ncbi:MAG TPA: SMC family ATPase [Gemmatimonadaceae bacterium]|nr:SMC family ATPase [Gemmatimonadaceae bacterium]